MHITLFANAFCREKESYGITESEFKRYKAVQESGKFNMMMDINEAMVEANLSYEKYSIIISYYHYPKYLINKFNKTSQGVKPRVI